MRLSVPKRTGIVHVEKDVAGIEDKDMVEENEG